MGAEKQTKGRVGRWQRGQTLDIAELSTNLRHIAQAMKLKTGDAVRNHFVLVELFFNVKFGHNS